MKKIATLVGMVALMIMVLAPAAMAVNKQCTNEPCWGTNSRDTLYERGGRGVPDNIIGRRYGDLINANAFRADRDVLNGSAGTTASRPKTATGATISTAGRATTSASWTRATFITRAAKKWPWRSNRPGVAGGPGSQRARPGRSPRPLSLSLFTGVRGRSILRTSCRGGSANFALTAF